jgi:hypothetical protein
MTGLSLRLVFRNINGFKKKKKKKKNGRVGLSRAAASNSAVDVEGDLKLEADSESDAPWSPSHEG